MSNSLIGPRLLNDIRETIRTVKGDAGQEGVIRIPTAVGGGGGGIRACTFTGAWAINAQKVVFTTVGTAQSTSIATNVLFPNIGHSTAHRSCLVSGSILVAARC